MDWGSVRWTVLRLCWWMRRRVAFGATAIQPRIMAMKRFQPTDRWCTGIESRIAMQPTCYKRRDSRKEEVCRQLLQVHLYKLLSDCWVKCADPCDLTLHFPLALSLNPCLMPNLPVYLSVSPCLSLKMPSQTKLLCQNEICPCFLN